LFLIDYKLINENLISSPSLPQTSNDSKFRGAVRPL